MVKLYSNGEIKFSGTDKENIYVVIFEKLKIITTLLGLRPPRSSKVNRITAVNLPRQ